jgi:hypothetical protein
MSSPAPKRPRGPRSRRQENVGDPGSTVRPSRRATRRTATLPAASETPISRDQLDAAILRFLRRFPNQTVDLAPLSEELKVDPFEIQLAVERLHRRRMVVAPFIEPGTAGGATLSEVGLRWLIQREGGRPADVPVLIQKAKDHVRAPDEAARLPRAQVYGVRRQDVEA